MSPAGYTSRPLWWIRWKSLRLPWRSKWLVGVDLQGNTFWEFKDQLQSHRLRRIVHSRHQLINMADLQLSPSWMQWLRHTRQDPPSIAEQEADVRRQREIKKLAQMADDRWEALAPKSTAPNAPSIPMPSRAPSSVVPLKAFSPPSSLTSNSSPSHWAGPATAVVSNPAVNTSTHNQVSQDITRHRSSRDQGPQPEAWVPKLGRRRE